ncbi:MAG: bacitracin ABC transporter ATP-binding protein [Acidobacteria bacterium]|nr:MAG: bacitracin ABC transporter ATP-binding protein [Acidobacteriota bacterium]
MTIAVPLELTGLTKVFTTPSGPYVAVRDVNARIKESEFVCILGHSGCGKSTVLSIIAGLQKATLGGVVLNGTEVDEPGMDRGVVFQLPCLLPWLTAGENVELAVRRAFPKYGRQQRRQQAEKYLALLGVPECYNQLPAELSLGIQQCVSLARALSLEPEFLLLDEPFSMLDSLTRLDLQDTLLEVWEKLRRIVVMVTHDVDEALYLADRLLLMTDGPEARIGEILPVPFARPRRRTEVLEHPEYYACRSRIIEFLGNCGGGL